MTNRTNREIFSQKAVFMYHAKQIVFRFWWHAEPGDDPDTILFLGTGQVGKTAKWVAAAVPAGVVVVEGLPHWHSHASAHDLVDFSNIYTKYAYEAVLEKFKRSRMHVVSESQAAPGVMWLINQVPEKISNAAFILPMGLNAGYFGNTDRERRRILGQRSLQTLLQPEQSPLHDVRNLYIATMLVRVNSRGLLNGSTLKKYTHGIAQDMLDEFRLLVGNAAQYNRHVSLLLGGKDKIFPAHEIKTALGMRLLDRIHIYDFPNVTHGSLAVRGSKPLLDCAVKAVRQI
jgi:hypothetical protein